MLKGLNKILKDDNLQSSVKQSMWEEDDFIFQDNYEKIEYKVEKISGALSFLDEIRTLRTLTDKVENYVDDILKFNVIIFPEVLNVIEKLKQEVQNLEMKIEEKFGPIVEQKRDYDVKLGNIRFEYELQNYDPTDAYYEFKDRYPEFQDFQKKYLVVERELNTLVNKLEKYRGHNLRFQEYVIIIHDNLDKYNMLNKI